MDAQTLPTDDEVEDFMDAIPAKLVKCAAARHNWQMSDWTGYDAKGKALKRGSDPNGAHVFEVTEVCTPCGYNRHYDMAWRHGRLKRISEYSYSERNPQLISPHGISQTSIVVRADIIDRTRENQITGRRLHLAPTGPTKRALSNKVPA
ncbi:hypothetical protein [Streptomyces sp. NPDC088775]|uniref:hypothetical protein n=1 Tax=Streptomyces sp. NPDC088775 TaxID=3365896 RepID=UPI003820F985